MSAASEAEAKRLKDFAADVAKALPLDALEARLRLSLLLYAALAHMKEADANWEALKEASNAAFDAECAHADALLTLVVP